MASFNRVVLIGNLTRDPEYKQLASGQALCRLGLAINRQFKNKQNGSMVQEVCYIDIDVWGPQAESCRQYLQKGRPVLVEGRLKYDSWEDQNGQTRSRHTIVSDRVVFLSSQGAAGVDADDSSRMASENALGDNNTSDESAIMQLNPNNPVERDLLRQLEQAKNKIQTAPKSPAKKSVHEVSASSQSSVIGEIDFKDEPPFEDQLPF